MPFQKGQSGNPAGRPKADTEMRDLARTHGGTALAKLVELLHGDDRRLVLQAAQVLLDRGFGKAAQAVTLSGDADNPLEVVTLVQLVAGVKAES